LLKPGMNGEVEVLVNERLGVLTVPNGAVVEPRQAAPAAEVLGLDPNTLDMRGLFAGRGAGGQRGNRGNRPAGTEGPAQGGAERAATPSDTTASAPRGGARAAFANLSEEDRTKMGAIRTQLRDGEITQEEAQTQFTTIVGEEAAQTMARGGFGGRGNGQGRPGAEDADSQAAPGGGEVTGRPGVVFVVADDGTIEARGVTLGIGDYDQTEVMAGLEEGERVALIGAAQLQAQQADFLNRIRGRNSGPFGGGGRR
jgi:hypothetical protein